MSKSTFILLLGFFVVVLSFSSCKKELTDGQLAEKELNNFINNNRGKINSVVVYTRSSSQAFVVTGWGYNYSLNNGFLRFNTRDQSFNLAFLIRYELKPCTAYCIADNPTDQLNIYLESKL